MKIAGIILAAGKGTRIKSSDTGKNKVTLTFLNKPLIVYGVELLQAFANPVEVVVGAYAESVKEVLKSHRVIYAQQEELLGTADAAKAGVKALAKLADKPDNVLVGYGDHTMFYKKETVEKLIKLHQESKAAISCITTFHNFPDKLAWGRIIRNKNGDIVDSIEQKDATEEQKKIKELNTCFYCFDFNFIADNIDKIEKSSVSGEYYLTDIIKLAIKQNKKVVALQVPFKNVGIGINRNEELEESQKIYLQQKI